MVQTTEDRLSVIQSNIMHLRVQLAEIADLAGYEDHRTFLFRELVHSMVIYRALLRKRKQHTAASELA